MSDNLVMEASSSRALRDTMAQIEAENVDGKRKRYSLVSTTSIEGNDGLKYEIIHDHVEKKVHLHFFTIQNEYKKYKYAKKWELVEISGTCNNVKFRSESSTGTAISRSFFKECDNIECCSNVDFKQPRKMPTHNREHRKNWWLSVEDINGERKKLEKDVTIYIEVNLQEGDGGKIEKYSKIINFKIDCFGKFTSLKRNNPKQKFEIDERLTNLFNASFSIASLATDDKELFTKLNLYKSPHVSDNLDYYVEKMKTALKIEYLSNFEQDPEQDQSKYLLKRVKFDGEEKKNEKLHHYSIIFENAELPKLPSQNPQDYKTAKLCLVPKKSFKVEGKKVPFYESQCHYVKMLKIDKDEKKSTIKIRFRINIEFMPDFKNTLEYYVFFKTDDFLEQTHAKIDAIDGWIEGCDHEKERTEEEKQTIRIRNQKQKLLQKYFFDFETLPECQPNNAANNSSISQWYNDTNNTMSLNSNQMQAVTNIINQTAFPFPYVVFGPTQSGKTSVIVEAIMQILKNNADARVLVTAPSDEVCDNIGIRLRDLLKQHNMNENMYRFYSDTDKNISSELKNASNMIQGKNKSPSMEELASFSVVIISLSLFSKYFLATRQATGDQSKQSSHNPTAEEAHSSNNQSPRPKTQSFDFYFNYIFFADSSAATVPDALLPIINLATDAKKEQIIANIVLVGDVEKKPPPPRSEFSSSLGLNVSLMEHVLKSSKYIVNEETQKYNPNFVTQLKVISKTNGTDKTKNNQ